MISLDNFDKGRITIIEGSFDATTLLLYVICVDKFDGGIIFIDGSNTFNPYILTRIAKAKNREIDTILQHIYVARAFTEYQFENLIESLQDIFIHKKPDILLISDMSSLFESIGTNHFYYNKFDKILDDLRIFTKESEIITIIAISGNTYYDTLISNKADRIIKSSEYDLGDIMGRTVPSFRQHLEEIESELSVFRRALHGEDKIAFDDLMLKARKHASSCTIVPTLDPFNCILLSILIEQQKEIKSLRDKSEWYGQKG